MAVIFAVNLAAQNKCTFSGYIRDAATGETLIGAGVMVMITDAASGTKASAAAPGSSAIGTMSAASASGTKSEEKASAATPGANASAATNDKPRANSRIIGAGGFTESLDYCGTKGRRHTVHLYGRIGNPAGDDQEHAGGAGRA